MKTKIMYTLLGFLTILIYYTGISKLLNWMVIQSNLVQALFYSCLLSPIFEEVLFRVAPLQLVKSIEFRSEATKAKMLIVIVLASSIIFGLMHEHGWNSVLKQGVMGLIFAIVYIRTGYSYLSAVSIHLLWNLYCVYLQYK